jgi:hypothetical protein
MSILVVHISAQTPSDESITSLSKGPTAGSSKTQANKRKATSTPPPPWKTQKVMSKKATGIKINDPALRRSPTLTPNRSWGGFTMRWSTR